MTDIYVNLPFDPTGTSATNLISGEPHTLEPISNFPYKITTMDNGGFYANSIRIYDASYKRLDLGIDYILSFKYPEISIDTGLVVGGVIVFIKPTTPTVYISGQMVGSDVAFSLTAVTDYVEWYNTQPVGYIPREMDFTGIAPEWLPGELNQERWRLDTFQPFNNEIYYLARATEAGRGNYEQNFRDDIKQEYLDFLELFTDRLRRHIDDDANPHVDNKSAIGLPLVANLPLATTAQSIAGNSIELYQTPAGSWLTLNEFALKPLSNHIANSNNPHGTTPDKIDSPTKVVVDSIINDKYLKAETVANANLFTNGTTDYEYPGYSTYARRDIPAANFIVGGDNGYIAPQRIGRGSPSAQHVLNSNGQWVTWSTLVSEYMSGASADLLVMNLWGNTPQDAHNIAISQPWAITAPIGSIILYRLNTAYRYGTGNGTTIHNENEVYGSYKSDGGWIRI